jgi:hypothetical protein
MDMDENANNDIDESQEASSAFEELARQLKSQSKAINRDTEEDEEIEEDEELHQKTIHRKDVESGEEREGGSEVDLDAVLDAAEMGDVHFPIASLILPRFSFCDCLLMLY